MIYIYIFIIPSIFLDVHIFRVAKQGGIIYGGVWGIKAKMIEDDLLHVIFDYLNDDFPTMETLRKTCRAFWGVARAYHNKREMTVHIRASSRTPQMVPKVCSMFPGCDITVECIVRTKAEFHANVARVHVLVIDSRSGTPPLGPGPMGVEEGGVPHIHTLAIIVDETPSSHALSDYIVGVAGVMRSVGARVDGFHIEIRFPRRRGVVSSPGHRLDVPVDMFAISEMLTGGGVPRGMVFPLPKVALIYMGERCSFYYRGSMAGQRVLSSQGKGSRSNVFLGYSPRPIGIS